MKRQAHRAKARRGTRHDGRRSGSKGPTAPQVNPPSCVIEAYEAAATGRLGTEAVVPEGRQRASESGLVSVKAPPAVAACEEARGVSIQGAARRRRAGKLTRGSGGSHAKPEKRVHRGEVERSGRARIANAHPSRVRPRERRWLVVEGSHSERRCAGNRRTPSKAQDPAESVIQTRT
jgi:hypothetical protein